MLLKAFTSAKVVNPDLRAKPLHPGAGEPTTRHWRRPWKKSLNQWVCVKSCAPSNMEMRNIRLSSRQCGPLHWITGRKSMETDAASATPLSEARIKNPCSAALHASEFDTAQQPAKGTNLYRRKIFQFNSSCMQPSDN